MGCGVIGDVYEGSGGAAVAVEEALADGCAAAEGPSEEKR